MWKDWHVMVEVYMKDGKIIIEESVEDLVPILEEWIEIVHGDIVKIDMELFMDGFVEALMSQEGMVSPIRGAFIDATCDAYGNDTKGTEESGECRICGEITPNFCFGCQDFSCLKHVHKKRNVCEGCGEKVTDVYSEYGVKE